VDSTANRGGITKRQTVLLQGMVTRPVQPIATGVLQRTVLKEVVITFTTKMKATTRTATIGCMFRPLQITLKPYTEIFVISFGYVLEHKTLKRVKL